MSVMEIAKTLVEGCRTGQESELLETLYSQDAVSVESLDFGNGREAAGMEAIKGKHAWWDATFEVIEAKVSDPLPHGDDRFAVVFDVKAKNKETSAVEDIHEIAVYHVADNKIVREEFFYGA